MSAELTDRMAALEQESDRWLHSNSARYWEISQQMLALSRGRGPAERARALRAHGNALRSQGRLPDALAAIRRALRLWRQAGDEVEWARTQTALVPVLAQLGKTRSAQRAAEAGLAVFLRHDQQLAAARLLSNLGGLFLYTGRPRQALGRLDQARELALAAGERMLLARIDHNRVLALQALGQHSQALAVCAGALRSALKAGQRLHGARALMVTAVSLFHLGRFGPALRRFSRARQLNAAESGQAGACDLHICACYLELNRAEQALGRLQAVLAEPPQRRAWFEQAWAWYYQGIALARLNRWQEGQAALQTARGLFTRHGDGVWAGRAALECAELLLRTGAPAAALQQAALSRRRFAGAGLHLERARACLLRAEAYWQTGRLQRAGAEARAALAVFSRAGTPAPAFRSLHLLGRIALQQGDLPGARKLLARAIGRAEQMRASVQVAFRPAFLDDKAAAYADLVWVHLLAGRAAAARRLADQAKSRALCDLLATPPPLQAAAPGADDRRLLAELEAARSEYQQLTLPARLSGPATAVRSAAPAAAAQRLPLEQRLTALWDEWELRRVAALPALVAPGRQPARTKPPVPRLAPGTALVEYLVIRDQVVAFVSDRRSLRRWLPVGEIAAVRKALELLELNLSAALAAGTSPPGRMAALIRNAQALLLQLWQQLWAPLLPWLQGAAHVVVIPHGQLHLVPFAGLYDGRRYLVEQTRLCLAPSRSVWELCRQRAARSSEPAPDLVLGCDADGRLPYIEAEARAVAASLGTEPHLGPAAALTCLQTAGRRRLVHLAVHGQFRPDKPDLSSLLLADGALLSADAAALRLQAALVVLSGCETGLSRVTRGDELVGMITAFLTAGAAAVVASHWRVDDRSTAALMCRMYDELSAGCDKAGALRTAQAELAARGLHPVYWAAFFLVGDASPLPRLQQRED